MYKKAVTFIELVIVVAIVGIMTSVLLVSTSGSRTDKALEAAAREVAAMIREAQNYALTGKDAGAGCNSYVFAYTDATNSYSVNNGCNINNSYTLKNGIVFNSGVSGSFNFSAPYGACSVVLGAPENIALSKSGKTIRVCVYSSGKVIETDIGAAGCP
ncbi:prepilin-type N-terminal cleavage/methylation domain-containing protein [bacterium]|nr:prepilin-type N-terminal cleavage/methylation domain-containing protein [bacterium]